ncbi:hypothetical protein T440DRAFT_32372 [Plenodomus tracheiphilus IPT5]|uniref:Uncharacterized protein n=1 Tax=Plenodomus tracheiphilus IPT5 TaxID=1408161 RepID=A0A6A7BEK6_9PLEO|nr:hypothetical protein T440DRAFT_32372 [Plenodomus tracheiphilus IPT5]
MIPTAYLFTALPHSGRYHGSISSYTTVTAPIRFAVGSRFNSGKSRLSLTARKRIAILSLPQPGLADLTATAIAALLSTDNTGQAVVILPSDVARPLFLQVSLLSSLIPVCLLCTAAHPILHDSSLLFPEISAATDSCSWLICWLQRPTDKEISQT